MGSRPRAIVLQECFKTKAELLALKIRGYRAIAATEGIKTTNGPRRGSVILVDLFLNVEPLKERTVGITEMIGVRVTGDTEKTYENPFELWNVYSGPYKKEALECKKMLLSLHKERKNRVLLAGDFNSDLVPGGSEVCKAVREVLEKMEEDGQASILNEYTSRTTPDGTVLDLGVTMGDWDVGFAYPIEYDLGSTHYPVCIGVATGESKTRKFAYEDIPRYKRTEESAAKLKKMCAAIGEDFQQHTGDTLVQAILHAITDCALDTTPKKKKQSQKHWWNDEIESLFVEKQNHLAKIGKKDEKFKEIDNKLQTAISAAKNASFQEFASGLNHCNRNGDVYRAMRNVGARRRSRVAELAVLTSDGKVITSMKEKANVLSRRYQVPLGHHPRKDPLRKAILKQNRKQREEAIPRGKDHISFSVAEARIAREDLANNKAPGLSRTRKEDLEMGGDAMDVLVTELADKIALSGDWPQTLKSNVVCPLPKEEEAADVIGEDKTRPIALLEALDKWLERMFYNRIIKHVEYEETQAGYCLSCDHHTSLVTDFVMNRSDNSFTMAVFTDISKAFDSVPLEELVDVIWTSTIPDAYKWVISSFVEARHFRVEIRDENGNVAASDWRRMLFGTPQGSVLGPFLWNLFFDPLLKKLAESKKESDKQIEAENNETEEDNIILDNLDTAFADDLTLLATSKDPKRAEKLLEKKLEIFKNFLTERGMEAAAHKLKIMSMDPQKRDYAPCVYFDGKIIEEVAEHKFLGIIFDKHMTFEAHWKVVVSSVANRTKTMSRLRGVSWGPTQQTAKVLHQSYIESRIRYGMPAWYPFLAQKLKSKLEVYLRRSIRIVMGLPIHCWNEALMAEADLDSVADMSLKSTVSLYARINPTDLSQMTLVKKNYLKKEPRWASQLRQVPKNIWEGLIQARLSKKVILATEKACVKEKTIETQKQAEAVEEQYDRIMYTDASVDISSSPPGKAAIGYIWYRRRMDGSWQEVTKVSATIGAGHSSYSAEAIAIQRGLKDDPELCQDEDADQDAELRAGMITISSGSTVKIVAAPPPTMLNTETVTRRESIRKNAVGIFTDSLSNLLTIKKGLAETPEQKALLQAIADYPRKTVFHHVRSHQDNVKNNEVDRLCDVKTNPAGREDASHLSGKRTASKIKSWMSDWVRSKRLKRVVNDRKARKRGSATQSWITKCLVDEKKNIAAPPRELKNLPRRKGVLMAKARTNRWTQCNWYLHFIKKAASPLCSTCKVSDTTEHVVDYCTLHEGPRMLLLQKLNYVGKVSTLLSSKNKKIASSVADFLVTIEDERKRIEKEERENQITGMITISSGSTVKIVAAPPPTM